MSAPKRFRVTVTKTSIFEVVVSATSARKALLEAQELFDTDNSMFEDCSPEDPKWKVHRYVSIEDIKIRVPDDLLK